MRFSARSRWVATILLALWTIFVLFPLYWTLITSFKDARAVFGDPSFLPFVDFQPSTAAWERILGDRGRALRSLQNSAVVGLSSAAVATALGCMAGYGLTRFRYRFGFMRNRDIAFWLVSNRILPPIAIVLPLFILFNAANLVDTRFGLFLLYTMFNLPIAAWLMHEYFKQVPETLDHAAMVDGASRGQAFLKIAVPLARPGMIATFLVCLMFAWNEFLFALIFTFNRAQTLPLLVAGQATQHGPQWWDIAAMATITVAPLAVITVILGNRIVEGLVSGWSD
jgi:multiple sugar transport system permease protein